MKILVTGGLGFIGTALSRRLLAAGHTVRIIDNMSAQIHGQLPSVVPANGAEFIRLDVRELADHPELVDGFDAVYHLAAETGTAQSMYQIRRYVSVNEMGTAALLEAIAKCTKRPRKIVLTSSRSVYGEGAYSAQDGGPLIQPQPRSAERMERGLWDFAGADGTPLQPVATPEHLGFAPGSIYAATKASQELLLRSAATALGFDATILRLQNVYGEGQSLQNPYTGIISIFFNRARQGLELPIYEDGTETRDFVHIDDVVAALVASLDPAVPADAICNVGSGVATPVIDLAHALLEAAGLDVPVRVSGQFRVGDIRHNFADIGAAAQMLGFTPKISLIEGLTRFCAWAADEPTYEDGLERATRELREKGLAK